MGAIDKSGEPRSKQELLEAREAVRKMIVQDFLKLPYLSLVGGILLDALQECIERRNK